MSTWKIGDSWVSTSGLALGTGGSKGQAQSYAMLRRLEFD